MIPIACLPGHKRQTAVDSKHEVNRVAMAAPLRGTPFQVTMARVVAIAVGAICALSANDDWLEKLPPGNLRALIEKLRDACRSSVRLSGVRSLTVSLVALWAHSVKIHNVSIGELPDLPVTLRITEAISLNVEDEFKLPQ